MDINKIFEASKKFILLVTIVLMVSTIISLNVVDSKTRSDISFLLDQGVVFGLLLWAGYDATKKYGMSVLEAGIVSAFSGAVSGAILSLVLILLTVTSAPPEHMNEALLVMLIFGAMIIIGYALFGLITGVVGGYMAKRMKDAQMARMKKSGEGTGKGVQKKEA